ncbi:MAG: hypothetical protein IPK20_20630 [Betaproteobacteria bacterium]|nr:hypothetical protein [Betaproteobacteria bacterium]
MKTNTLFAAFAAATWLYAGTASAVVIDFESLTHAGLDVVAIPVYQEDGFRFSSDVDPVLADAAFSIWGTGGIGFNGSTALFNTFEGQTTTMQSVDASPFSLQSITVGPMIEGLAGTLTFVGELAGGGEVTQNFTFGPALLPQVLTFGTGFAGLSRVMWLQGNALEAHQFDNLVVNQPIPEMRTGAFVLAGLAVLGVWRSRKTPRRRFHPED